MRRQRAGRRPRLCIHSSIDFEVAGGVAWHWSIKCPRRFDIVSRNAYGKQAGARRAARKAARELGIKLAR
jgi:hypothetical protein